MKSDDAAVQTLENLDQGVPSAGWRDPGELRGIARRRSRSRRAMAVAATVVVTAGIVAAVHRPGTAVSPTPIRVAAGLHVDDRVGAAYQLVADSTRTAGDPHAAAAVAGAEQRFALALLRNAAPADASANVVLSPSSLAIALAMLQTGAGGATRDQIARVLRTSHLTSEQQDAGWAALADDLTAAAKADVIDLQSANSLWLQLNLPMRKAFMADMAEYFRTGVWQVDFEHDLNGATDAINAWTEQHTEGKITKLFGKGAITPDTLLVLANAVHFEAKWLRSFDPKLTKNATFHLANGATKAVPFMASGGNLRYARTPGYDAVQLPYDGSRFAALVVMPKQQTLQQFADRLPEDGLDRIGDNLTVHDVDLRLPRFNLSTYANLGRTLGAMGMVRAFTPSADFSAMSRVPMMVQSVVQRDYLRVDEKGTAAAAATGIATHAVSSHMTPSITFDHPFLFLIRDTETGTILFEAQVQNPAG